jgi:hypothetical protein
VVFAFFRKNRGLFRFLRYSEVLIPLLQNDTICQS